MTTEEMQRLVIELTARDADKARVIVDLTKRIQQLEMQLQHRTSTVIPIRPSTTRRSSMVLGEFIGDDGA